MSKRKISRTGKLFLLYDGRAKLASDAFDSRAMIMEYSESEPEPYDGYAGEGIWAEYDVVKDKEGNEVIDNEKLRWDLLV